MVACEPIMMSFCEGVEFELMGVLICVFFKYNWLSILVSETDLSDGKCNP